MQVFEVGTQTMMLSGAVYPVHELMQQNEIRIDWNDFIKPVVGYYTKDGKLYSMPYNSSTPIFYYNKDAFKKAGLDPEKPPKTWQDVEAYSKKILAAGAAKCGFSTGWPSWTMVENMHATHDQPFATKNNGFGGVEGVELLINREFGQKHVGGARRLAEGQRIYSYGGRAGAADPKFVSGDCAMYIQSSALISGFTQGREARLGHRRATALGRAVQEGDVDHRGRDAVGAQGQAASRVPRRGPIPGVPGQAREPDVVARQHRLPGHLQHRRAATSSRATTS